MRIVSRRTCLAWAGFALATRGGAEEEAAAAKRLLPMKTIFKGEERFNRIVQKAIDEKWGTLKIGDRIIKVAKELEGLPYENFTLEIDDHIESPSANLNALDCWTFFEQCLGFARMLGIAKESYTADDLLRQIEFTRYRGGRCTGDYLERIHYLAEWFFDNDARGTCRYLAPTLPGAERILNRKVSEMTTLWKSYRYLRNNPELRPPMKETEERVEKLPVFHVPKAKVAAIEPLLQDGDVIGIATKYDGAFCSHVGLIHRTDDGVARFMHASRNYKKVVVDKSVSGYLDDFSAHAGILVGRPLELSETVLDEAVYQSNLKKLLGDA